MKVYLCKEWVYQNVGDGYWEGVKVMSDKQRAIDWVMNDFNNRSLEEFYVE